MTTTTRQCPSCNGQNLTKPGKLQASGHSLHRQFAVDDGSWLGTSVMVYMESVICADCGHVSIFARPDDLERLRSRWQQLKD